MTENNFYDLQQLKDALAGRIDEFILTLYPNAKREASCYKIGSTAGEKGSSLMISTRANNPGYFIDFADPDVKGNAWRLVSLNRGCTIREGIAWLAHFLNIPPIQSFGGISKASDPEKLAREFTDLSPKSIEYATKRGITEETLRKYGVGSDRRNGLLFPYYDAFGNLGMVKHWGHELKADGKKDTWIMPSMDSVQSLFGKDVCDPETNIQKLIITEGEWDAMACWQIGLPAVSIPMGASNTNWITEDYQFLSHFDEIILLFDNDEAGKKSAKEAAARLGTERCLIVTLPLKDANDMLKTGRGAEIKKIIETTTREPIAEIVESSSIMESTRSYMKGDHLSEGDPFFLPDYKLNFRKHESTLWFGFTGHGKSTAVSNQVAMLAAKGKQACVASFEQPPEMTFAQILTQFSAYPNLPYTEEFEPAFNYLAKHIFMYKSMERVDPKHLVNTFIHAHKRYGIDTFVIDNVMTMQIDRGDNTAQAEAADLLRMFVAKYPVHLHIVAHPRKPPENTNKPPSISDIRGASEWADMVYNVVTVWRDTSKAEREAEMEDSAFSKEERRVFFESTPCGKVIVRKQRTTGEWPIMSYFFDSPTKRFTCKPGAPRPMYSEKPWHYEIPNSNTR
jgi:twinkle protein